MSKLKYAALAIAGAFVFATQTAAQDVRITSEIMSVEYSFAGKTYLIGRNQDTQARVPAAFAKTSRPCPVFCVQPMVVHESVETVGELELLDYLVKYVSAGDGFLIDSRTPDFYVKGTIPGAVNLPFNILVPAEDNVFFDSVMNMLGGEKTSAGAWDFGNAKHLMMFCNGPWCGQSPTAIRNLIAINYPVEKLHYYRGGMQGWVGMGFNTAIPE